MSEYLKLSVERENTCMSISFVSNFLLLLFEYFDLELQSECTLKNSPSKWLSINEEKPCQGQRQNNALGFYPQKS